MIAVLACLAAACGAGHATRGDCVDITFASSLGGQEISACGGTARSLCAHIDTPGGYSGRVGRLLAADCRRRGLKVG